MHRMQPVPQVRHTMRDLFALILDFPSEQITPELLLLIL